MNDTPASSVLNKTLISSTKFNLVLFFQVVSFISPRSSSSPIFYFPPPDVNLFFETIQKRGAFGLNV